ncbi:hypothetical protein XI05_24225 [Bradyrhizobium sp. CCBAU 11357]|nr:hypothetical protein [Bradyrhizobium sp. CCBAU 11357]
MGLAAAREKARKLQVALQEDPDVFAKQKQAEEDKVDRTFSAVVKEFEKRYVEKNGIRTGRVMMQQIEKHLMPTLKDRDINSIRRKELTKLLDKIEDKHGPSMADAVLAAFRSLAKFHALRDDGFNSPIIPGMKRYKTKQRTRVLNDAELRAFWNATEGMGIFGALARTCLLTGARRAKVHHMKHADIENGVWTLGHEDREKPNAGLIKLPPLALSIIENTPRIERNPYVFPGTRLRGPFSAWDASTTELLRLMRLELPDMEHFTVHDLRRTFRTRLSRLKIDPHIAERCIGHVVGNTVTRTYDLWEFFDEKTAAFAAFAAHVQQIVSPPPASNVVRLPVAVAH